MRRIIVTMLLTLLMIGIVQFQVQAWESLDYPGGTPRNVYVQTPGLLEALKDKNSPTGGKSTKSYLKKFASGQAALKRLPLGSEVAKTCVFFASDESSAITAQSVNVDCGVLPA